MLTILTRLLLLLATFHHTLLAQESEIVIDPLLPDKTSDLRMKDESLQWTPAAITVISREDLDDIYRHDLEDLEGIAPGIIFDGISGAAQGAMIASRGVGSNEVSRGFVPTVPVVVDGVAVGSHSGAMFLTFDIEKVEARRGPQGLFGGPAAAGGSINITRSLPRGEWHSEVGLAFGTSHKSQEFNAILHLPEFAGISTKFAVMTTQSDGDYMHQCTASAAGIALPCYGIAPDPLPAGYTVSTRRENEEDQTFLTFALLWQPRDNLSIHYTFDSDKDDSNTPALLNISQRTQTSQTGDRICDDFPQNCGSDVAPQLPETGILNLGTQNASNLRTLEGDYHTLRINAELLDFDVLSITGIRTMEEEANQDLDATYIDYLSRSSRTSFDHFSQEFRLTSPLQETLNYNLGLYVSKTESSMQQDDYFIASNLLLAGLSTPCNNCDALRVQSDQKTDVLAVYANLFYKLNEQWNADFSIRVDDVDKEILQDPSGLLLGTIIQPGLSAFGSQSNWTRLTTSTSLSYKVDEEAMIYFRHSTGFRSGGYDDQARSPEALAPFETQDVSNFELGLKSEWFDDNLRVNVIAYKEYYEDAVQRFPRANTSGNLEWVLGNIPSVEITGYEAEITWIAMTDLRLHASISHTKPVMDRYNYPDWTSPGDFIDLQPTYKPNWVAADSLYLSAKYTFPFWQGYVSTFAAYRYTTDYRTGNVTPLSRVPNYSRWDLSIDYQWQAWTISLFARNYNDKRYLQNIQTVSGASYIDQDPALLDPALAEPSDWTGNPTLNVMIPAPLLTHAELSEPEFVGVELVYRPDLGKLL